MHLCGHALTTTGKRKSRFKWASAEQKRQAEQAEADWKNLQKRWGAEADERKVSAFNKLSPSVKVPDKSMKKLSTSLPRIPVGRGTDKIESLVTNWGPCLKVEDKQYTGTEVLGIAVQHKSCLQPIFNQEAAKDSASMRR
jgi:hypothetical protein